MSKRRNKMYDYEVSPPPETWGKIAAALDESSSENKFPAALFNMEIPPPATAWETIADSLDETTEKVVPLRRKAPMFFRYAAAAIFIGIIAWGVFKWTGNISTDQAGTALTNPVQDTNKNPVDAIKDAPQNDSTPYPARENPPDQNMLASLDQPLRNALQPAVRLDINRSKDSDLSSNEDSVSSIAGRYIMLMTPEGNIIRMSKKWSDLVCCVSGEEQDEDCKLQIKQWQKKLANSPINPTPGNFMDILELVNSLDEVVEL